jgi:hypothetical protein
MALSAVFKIIKLRKWFPPDDPLAVPVARLCILREDFLLEMLGTTIEDIPLLDEHSPEWRRMYFLRNIFRTLMEILGVIQGLLSQPSFRELLSKQSSETQTMFEELARAVAQGHPVLKEVRNDIGGHVLESAVREALAGMDNERWGILEAAPKQLNSHFKFAGELVAEILVAKVPTEQRTAILESKLARISEMFPAFALCEVIFSMYAADRELFRRDRKGQP